MKVESERWYVIGCPERNAYMHWKGDHSNGSYTDTGDLREAERFETRAEAARVARVDKQAVQYLNNRKGMGFRVCHIERVTRAI